MRRLGDRSQKPYKALKIWFVGGVVTRLCVSLIGRIHSMGRNMEKRKEYDARWRAKNREKRNADNRRVRRALKEEVLRQYGTNCKTCGFEDKRALQIDHIDGSGATERRALGGKNFAGWRFYDWLKKQGWPLGYQTLCANCNLIKYLGDDF